MKKVETQENDMQLLSDDDLNLISGGYGETYQAGQILETEGVTLHFPPKCPVCGATTYKASTHSFYWTPEGYAWSVYCTAIPGNTYHVSVPKYYRST